MMRNRIQQTSDGMYAAWNAHDPEALEAVYAEDTELFDVVSGVTTHGRDSIHSLAVQSFAGFSDFSVTRHSILIDGLGAADRWTMTGTHTGEYEGLPPTGNRIEVSGATFFEYEDQGLITRSTNYVDIAAYFRQLGLT